MFEKITHLKNLLETALAEKEAALTARDVAMAAQREAELAKEASVACF